MINEEVTIKDKDQLTIAGEFWKGKEDTQQKIKSLGIEGQIELRPQYHSDQDTAELFDRSDVVLPYRSATGNGVVPIAYHYNKPVIVTNVGGLPDVVREGKTGLIIESRNVTLLSEMIIKFRQIMEQDWTLAIQNIKKDLSWTSLSNLILTIES